MFENIWFTFKARIRTQERLAHNDLHSQVLLVWYAVLGACLSIITIRHSKVLGEDTDIISAMFGVAVLAMSMLVTNRDFRGRSLEMRRNYLALQDLYAKTKLNPPVLSQADVYKAYQDLISAVENHSEMDDKYFRVFHKGKLDSRTPNLVEKLEVYAYLAVRTVVLVMLYLFPFSVLLLR